jgi:hypothetical protein
MGKTETRPDGTVGAEPEEDWTCPDGQPHDVRESARKCGRCGAELCEICMSDAHRTSDGHDLSRPEYWGV